MNNQESLFYEDVYDVLKAVVQATGGVKVVAAKLWPTIPIERARQDLADALNPKLPRKLDPEETFAILRLGREAGFHAGKHWIDSNLGYEPTPPSDPKMERDRLADAILEGTRTLARAIEIAERQQRPRAA